MKFCKDCKHYDYIWWKGRDLAECRHPSQLEYNKVTGVATGRFCSTQRSFDHLQCGPDGKLWEPKQ